MDVFTLILTVSIFSSSTTGNVPGVAVSTTYVPGFATLEDCNQAGADHRVPSDRKFYEVDKTWSCVKTKMPS